MLNAREATGPEGTVTVSLIRDDGNATLTIDDDGPGWPEERERELDPHVTTKASGTGLGLSIVQRTVLQHGGNLELQDRPGGGARVSLVFPLGSLPDRNQE